MNKNKLNRIKKELINKIKSIRFSTIYKIFGIIILIFTLYEIFTVLNKSKQINNDTIEYLSGTIIDKGTDYIIVSANNNEYLIENIKIDFNIGSSIKTTIQSVIDNNTKPIKIVTEGINIINDNINSKDANKYIEDYVLNANKLFSGYKDNESEIKLKFQNIIEFLLFNKKINNYSLNDINSKTKLNILKNSLYLNTNMEKYFSGYKESLNYYDLKNKIIVEYLNKASKICKYDTFLCNNAKNDFKSMKETFGINWSTLKDLATTNENLKDWYEIYS